MAILVAEYLLKENTGTVVHDTSGNGYNGTIVDPTNPKWSVTVPGLPKCGLLFNGAGGAGGTGIVALPDAVLADDAVSVTDASLEAWVYLPSSISSGGPTGAIIDLCSDLVIWTGASIIPSSSVFVPNSGFGGWLYAAPNGTTPIIPLSNNCLGAGHQGEAVVGCSPFAYDSPQHVVMTRAGTLVSIYRNGVLIGTATANTDPVDLSSATGPKNLGANIADDDPAMKGVLLLARIWNGALTAGQVLGNYNAGYGACGTTPPMPMPQLTLSFKGTKVYSQSAS